MEQFGYLNLQGLRVRDWRLWFVAKAAMELPMAALPPALARLSWAQALYAMEQAGGSTSFSRAMEVLARCIVEPAMSPAGERRCGGPEPHPPDTVLRAAEDGGRLKYVIVDRGEQSVWLELRDLDRLREVLCRLNGYTLPDDNSNPELLRAAGSLSGKVHGGQRIVPDFEDLVYAAAVHSGISPELLWDWDIRAFWKLAEAVDRKIHYPLLARAELQGIRFRNGNPVPSWKFAASPTLPAAFQTLNRIEGTENK